MIEFKNYKHFEQYCDFLLNKCEINIFEKIIMERIINKKYIDEEKKLCNFLKNIICEQRLNRYVLEYLLNGIEVINLFGVKPNKLLYYSKNLSTKTQEFIVNNKLSNIEKFNVLPLISQIFNFLLDYNIDLKETRDFLLESIYLKNDIPNFHVKDLNEEFIKAFPNGIIPLGMAHGALKAFIALSKYYRFSKDEFVRDELVKLFAFYEIFSRREGEVLVFPNFITMEEISQKVFKVNIKNKRAAWCSGNLITTYSLYTISKNLCMKNKEIFYRDEVYKILNQNIEDFNLELPIICHGYSFPLILINKMLKDSDYINEREYNTLVNKKNILLKILVDVLESSSIDDVYENKFYSNPSLMWGLLGVLVALKSSIEDCNFIYKYLMIGV